VEIKSAVNYSIFHSILDAGRSSPAAKVHQFFANLNRPMSQFRLTRLAQGNAPRRKRPRIRLETLEARDVPSVVDVIPDMGEYEPTDVASTGEHVHDETCEHGVDGLGNEYYRLSPLPHGNPPPNNGPREPPYPLGDTFKLHSRPTANHVIYLDFDGHVTSGTLWNTQFTNGNSFTTPAFDTNGNTGSFSDAELERIQLIFQRVMEDFSPFDVDVTTEFPGLERLRNTGGADTQWGIRVVIGGDGAWFGGGGGVAYLRSFDWNSDTPCFVFEDNLANGNEKYTTEAISHEVGHTLELSHDGRTSPAEEYYEGHGSGVTGWAPIMGVGYYRELSQWSKGEYPSANNPEDDLDLITTRNGFGYRADDHGNTRATASSATVNGSSVTGAGVIERRTDFDYFKFTAGAGNITISISPFVRSPNLDILAELYDSAGTLLTSSNPAALLTASISYNASAQAEFFLKIDGVGRTDISPGYTDYGSLGQFTFSGTIVPPELNDAPVLDNTGDMFLTAIAEDNVSNNGTLISDLIASAGGDRITDQDTGAVEGIAVIAAATTNGSWEYSTNNGSAWNALGAVTTTFGRLLASDSQTRIRFVPNANFAGTVDPAITFRAWDQTSGTNGGTGDPSVNGGTTAFSTATETARITVTPINDAPVLDNTGTMSLASIAEDEVGNAGALISDIIASATGDRITDVDAGAVEGIAVTAADTANGSWQYTIDGGTNWNALGSVSSTNARLLAANSQTRIRFVPNANFNGLVDPAITFRAWDQTTGINGDTADPSTNGGTTAFSTATETASITVNPVNDAPLLDNSGNLVLNAIAEDEVGNSGTTIIAILASAGGDPITDIDSGAVEGIAVTAADTANGAWQYTINGGTDWNALGSVSSTSARLLAASTNTRIRFVPSANFNGTVDPAITFRAWDQSSGSNGGTADPSTNGGTTAFSTAIETAKITITPVNDAPVLDNSGALALNSIAEDEFGNSGTTITAILASAGGDPITDVDAGAVEGIAVTAANTANGSWQYSTNGTDWSALGSVSGTSARLLAANGTTRIRFVPNANFNGTIDPAITFRAWDQTTGANGDTADVSSNGGTTAFSTAIETATITVTPINDAPVLDNSGAMSLTTILEDDTANSGTRIVDLIASASGDRITDPDSGALEGIAVTAAEAINGSWQYSTNDGSNWSALGSVSGTSARLLAANATTRIRFVPNANFNGTVDPAITFRAWDQTSGSNGDLADASANGGTTAFSTATETARIVVTAVNDPPSFTKGANQVVDEDSGGQTVTGWATNMSPGPTDESGQTLTFQLTTNNDALFSALPAVNATTGTLTYTPAANASGAATVTIRLKDNGGTDNGGQDTSADQTFTITINPINDAPVLDNTGTMSLAAIAEDEVGNAGTLVTDIIASATGDRITDVDAGAVEGIAVTAADTANGSWQYTINGGSDWNPLGSVTGTFARLLAANGQTRIRFVPNGNFNGTVDPAITFRAWDQTSGSNGGTGDPSTNGGTTAFSTATETARITVNPVNDAPVLDNTGTMTLIAIAEDDVGNAGTLISAIISSAGGDRITDIDSGAVEGIAVTAADTANGAWQYTINGGTDWLALGSVSATSARLLAANGQTSIRFVPNANFNGTVDPAITFRAWDQTSGTNGGTGDPSNNGGTTAYSTATESASIAVTAVNDAPSFAKGANQSVLEDAGGQTVTGWATGITPGPADETGQTVSFLVSADNVGLFSVQPAIAPNGTLTYTPAADANGSATVTVRLQDNGGTANGGQDTSGPQTFTITINSVNDVPSFARGPDQVVAEDAGAQTVNGWATSISPGPANESGQTLTFLVTTDNDALFSVSPSVSPAGTLTFTPAANVNGSATVTVRLKDDGGTDNGGADTSSPQTFTVTVNAVNDAPVLDNTGAMALTTILEDASGNSGTNIAALIASAGGDRITDVDAGAVEGIAIIAADTANGVWEYSTNDGAAWSLIGAVDNTSARLLAAETQTLIRFVPNANFNGTVSDGVTFRAWDRTFGANGALADASLNGGATAFSSATETASIAVIPVNDAPAFTKGANESRPEDSGPASVPAWATGIVAGPADESGQALSFLVTTDNAALFSTLPTVSANGLLTYAAAANAFGTATVTVRLQDTGGTDNGGIDTSQAQTFTIEIRPVNDAPSFTQGGDQTVDEDPGTQTVPDWATGMSPGPVNESTQALTFQVVSNSNPDLFAAGPTVSPDGTLTYTPAANANGTATISIRVADDGGTADGGVDVSPTQSFTITVHAVNDAPTAATDDVDAIVGKALTIKVLANDFDVDGDPIQLDSFTAPANGTLRRQGNSFVYNTRLLTAGTDSFTYTISDGQGGSSTGAVAIRIVDLLRPRIQAVQLHYGPTDYVNASSLTRSNLPWERLHRIAVVFNEGVVVDPAALTLVGPGGVFPTDFVYDPATRTATWTPTVPIENTRVTIWLAGGLVADASGNLLTKDWARSFGVLSGDFDGNGVVNDRDAAGIRKKFTRPGLAHNRFADVDGNGIVDQTDLDKAKANKGRRLR
jgi:hypothetical protein